MCSLSRRGCEKVIPQMLQMTAGAAAAVAVMSEVVFRGGGTVEVACVRLTWLSCAACEANALPQCLH